MGIRRFQGKLNSPNEYYEILGFMTALINVHKLDEFGAQFGMNELAILHNRLLFASAPTPLTLIVMDFVNYLYAKYTIKNISDRKLSRIINLRMQGKSHDVCHEIDQLQIINFRASADIARDLKFLLAARNTSEFSPIIYALYNYSLRQYRNSLLAEYRDEVWANIIGADLLRVISE